MNDLALSKKIEELIKENSSLTQENRMLKHQKDRLGINYITTPEKGDAQSLLNGEIPFLKKIPELSLIKDDKDSDELFEVAANTDHLLIESDNLSALVTLQHTHADKIDVIYIDPPYNTGNKDFVYNDSFVSNDDGFRHSKWLSFMRPRLELAKKLLSETGVIFVSIDDNEQAYLKVLMDEIFGEGNFVDTIMVELSSTQGMKVAAAKNGRIVKNGEYVLVYSKSPDSLFTATRTPLYDSVLGYDSHFSQYFDVESGVLITLGEHLAKQDQFSHLFDATKPPSIKTIAALLLTDEVLYNYVFSKISSFVARQMMISLRIPDSVQKELSPNKPYKYTNPSNGRTYWLVRNSAGTIRQLLFLASTLNMSDDLNPEFGRTVIRGDFWKKFYLDMMNISKEGGVEFLNGKKPVRLIKQLVKWAVGSNPNAIVLDFFAGSGTTGHAVAELNAEDGGTRQAILITNSGEASRLSREDFKKSVNALTDSQLSILKEKIIVDEQVNSNSLPVRTSPNKWGKAQESFEIKKSGLFATIVGSANEHYVRWQKICDYLEIENVFDPVNLASDVTAERMKRVLTGKNWPDGKKHNSFPGNLQYYKLELDNLTKDVYSIPDKINLQKYVGVVSLEENAHNVLEQLPDTYKDGNNSIENNDAIVLSSDDKLVLVYGNYDKALFAEDDFINTVNNVKNFAEITNKVFKLYVVSAENEIFTIDDFVATPYPILYTTKVDKTVSTLEKQGFLVKDVESN